MAIDFAEATLSWLSEALLELAPGSAELCAELPLGALALELISVLLPVDASFEEVVELETCDWFSAPVIWTCCPTSEAREEVSPLKRQWLPESSMSANDLSLLSWLRQPSTIFG